MSADDRPCRACAELIPFGALFCGNCGLKDPHGAPAVVVVQSDAALAKASLVDAAAPDPIDHTVIAPAPQQPRPYQGPVTVQPTRPAIEAVGGEPPVVRSRATIPAEPVAAPAVSPKITLATPTVAVPPPEPSPPPVPAPAAAATGSDDKRKTMIGKSSLPPRVGAPPIPAEIQPAAKPTAKPTDKPTENPTDKPVAKLDGLPPLSSPRPRPPESNPRIGAAARLGPLPKPTAPAPTTSTPEPAPAPPKPTPAPPKKVASPAAPASPTARAPIATMRTPAVVTAPSGAVDPDNGAAPPDLTEEISEARFLLAQGLEEDGRAALRALTERHPRNPEVVALGREFPALTRMDAPGGTAAHPTRPVDPEAIELAEDELEVEILDVEEVDDDVDDTDPVQADAAARDVAAREPSVAAAPRVFTAQDDEDDGFGADIDAALDNAIDLDADAPVLPTADAPDGLAAPATAVTKTTDAAPVRPAVGPPTRTKPIATREAALSPISGRGKAKAGGTGKTPTTDPADRPPVPRGSTAFSRPAPPPGPRPPQRADSTASTQVRPNAIRPAPDAPPANEPPEPHELDDGEQDQDSAADWPAPDPGGTQVVRIPYAADEPTTLAGPGDQAQDDSGRITIAPGHTLSGATDFDGTTIPRGRTLAPTDDDGDDDADDIDGEHNADGAGQPDAAAPDVALSPPDGQPLRRPRITIVPDDPSKPAAPRPFGGESSPATPTPVRPATVNFQDEHEAAPPVTSPAASLLSPAPSAPPPSRPPSISTPTPPHGAAVAGGLAEPVRLVMLGPRGEAVAERTILPGHALVIGRSSGDPWSDDRHMELQHAHLVPGGAGLFVEELVPAGVFVQVAARMPLRDGDEFKVGQSWLQFARPPGGPGWGQLTVQRHGDQPVQTVPVGGAGLLMGRDDGDVSFPGDTYVSGEHCRLSCDGNDVWIEDLGSSNGTYVRVRAGEPVAFGSLLLIGHTQFKVHRG